MRTPIFNAVNLSEEGDRGYTLMDGVYPSQCMNYGEPGVYSTDRFEYDREERIR